MKIENKMRLSRQIDNYLILVDKQIGNTRNRQVDLKIQEIDNNRLTNC